MKPVSIHPFSALAGAGLLGLVILATGAVQTPGLFQKLARWFPGPIEVVGVPDPRHMLVCRSSDLCDAFLARFSRTCAYRLATVSRR